MRFLYLPLLLQIYGAWGASADSTTVAYFWAEVTASLSSGTHYAHLVLPDQPGVIAFGQFVVPECDNNSDLILQISFSASTTSDKDVLYLYSSDQGYPPIDVNNARPIVKRDTYVTLENTIKAYCDNGNNSTQTTASSFLTSAGITTSLQPGETMATVTGDSVDTTSPPNGTDQPAGDPTPGTWTTAAINPGQSAPSVTSSIPMLSLTSTSSVALQSSATCNCCSA